MNFQSEILSLCGINESLSDWKKKVQRENAASITHRPNHPVPRTMASKPPKSSLDSRASVKHLIVDSSPLLTAPISSLRGIATNYLVTPDVVLELRDKNGRNVLDEAKLQLPADYQQEGEGEGEGEELMRRKQDGFQVREPTAESIAKSKSSPLYSTV